MSLSHAKKMRLKMIREGRFNPEINRGSWNGINPVERKTASITEKKKKLNNKHKKKWADSSFEKDEMPTFLLQ